MDYDNNYIEVAYNPEELNEIFIKEFISFRYKKRTRQGAFFIICFQEILKGTPLFSGILES